MNKYRIGYNSGKQQVVFFLVFFRFEEIICLVKMKKGDEAGFPDERRMNAN